jgi:nitrite reductase (NO-forming)
VGATGAILSALMAPRILLATSIATYFIGAALTFAPSMFLLRAKKPDRASAWMLLSGAIGFLLLLIGDFIVVVSHHSPEKILAAVEGRALLIFTLWLFPSLLGAMTYLLPVVLGRGPASTKVFAEIMNRGWQWRVMLLPLASIFLLLPSRFHPLGGALTMIALAVFLGLTVRATWSGKTRSVAF